MGDDKLYSCNCRVDWVLCFWQKCPRARLIREAQQRAIADAQRIMGDPRIGVGSDQKASP